MRKILALMILATVGSVAQAQDPGMMAAQQAQQAAQAAQQAAQQASDQAMQAAQQANQQAAQAAQQASQNAQTNWGPGLTATPKFSVKPGAYDKVVSVRITDSARDSVIYYTTDGWTPTPDSPIYRGPITIDKTTTLQAVAVSPYSYRSIVATAKYTINLAQPSPNDSSALPPEDQPTAIPDGVAAEGPMPRSSKPVQGAAGAVSGEVVLQQDTPVPLIFETSLNSKTAQVGDTIRLSLAEDLISGGAVVAKKGTPAVATVVAVNHTGAGGAPGDITFEADSMTVNGTVVKLYGTATREGQAKTPNAAVLIPVVGPFTAFRHGTDAVIDQGTPFTAFVDSDTQVAALAKN
ncbi:MAG TPA: chitobiase/beta-hexosaminidase C-terminal domain-containing protein [Candidatus Acidoferrales bacterium]|nr:chitobiase/beta-hexosaminidase C-terminal domain-containing protein [Candidatus Acidoferrales bacterium]